MGDNDIILCLPNSCKDVEEPGFVEIVCVPFFVKGRDVSYMILILKEIDIVR